MTKFCVDCRHYRELEYSIFPRCAIIYEQTEVVNLVSGKSSYRSTASFSEDHCDSQRVPGKIMCRVRGRCGSEGRWWEPKA